MFSSGEQGMFLPWLAGLNVSRITQSFKDEVS